MTFILWVIRPFQSVTARVFSHNIPVGYQWRVAHCGIRFSLVFLEFSQLSEVKSLTRIFPIVWASPAGNMSRPEEISPEEKFSPISAVESLAGDLVRLREFLGLREFPHCSRYLNLLKWALKSLRWRSRSCAVCRENSKIQLC